MLKPTSDLIGQGHQAARRGDRQVWRPCVCRVRDLFLGNPLDRPATGDYPGGNESRPAGALRLFHILGSRILSQATQARERFPVSPGLGVRTTPGRSGHVTAALEAPLNDA